MPTAPGPSRMLTALGLMSGTSMDGVDAAILITDGVRVGRFGPAASYPYPATFRNRLQGVLGREPGRDMDDLVRDLTRRHVDAVRRLLRAADDPAAHIDVIGFHGHTVVHRPELRITRQIGDGDRLARDTGVTVVDDFRGADVAAGGHGAPLVPLYHAALAEALPRPLAVLNIGGVANVTWIGPDTAPDGAPNILAFDTGPGNALIDDWVRRVSGQRWDERGRMARGGRIRADRIADWMRDAHFAAPPPKSLDRNTYARVLDAVRDLGPEDGAATLTAFTVEAVAAARAWFPAPPVKWLVSGGGRHNRTLMGLLADVLAVPVAPVEEAGWDGDALEAQAFAFLAVRTLAGLPLSLPTTTGVPTAMPGGVVHRPFGEAHTGAVRTLSM